MNVMNVEPNERKGEDHSEEDETPVVIPPSAEREIFVCDCMSAVTIYTKPGCMCRQLPR